MHISDRQRALLSHLRIGWFHLQCRGFVFMFGGVLTFDLGKVCLYSNMYSICECSKYSSKHFKMTLIYDLKYIALITDDF